MLEMRTDELTIVVIWMYVVVGFFILLLLLLLLGNAKRSFRVKRADDAVGRAPDGRRLLRDPCELREP